MTQRKNVKNKEKGKKKSIKIHKISLVKVADERDYED